MITATQIRAGMIIVRDGELYRVLKMTHVTPGKGHAHVQVKVRNLKSGTTYDWRFNSDDKVEKAHLDERSMQYLYKDGEGYHFMDLETYETIPIQEELLEEQKVYLQENDEVTVTFYEGKPVGVEIPPSAVFEVVSTEPVMKGATAAGGGKPATLSNGITVTVPQFVKVGDKVRIDTRTGEYLERVQ